MKKILAEIQDGSFAEAWMDEYHAGSKVLHSTRDNEQNQKVETVGKELREMMSFLDAK